MEVFHRLEGYALVAGWLALFLWGCVLFVARRDAGRGYWALLAVLQVVVGVQVVAGVVLFALGGRPPLLHYFYGAVFPLVVLVVAHVLTRGLERRPYHVYFTGAAFVVAALAGRALMTGLGTG